MTRVGAVTDGERWRVRLGAELPVILAARRPRRRVRDPRLPPHGSRREGARAALHTVRTRVPVSGTLVQGPRNACQSHGPRDAFGRPLVQRTQKQVFLVQGTQSHEALPQGTRAKDTRKALI